MKPLLIVIGALGVVVGLAPIPARAQSSNSGRPRLVASSFDLRPGLTKDEFDEFTAEVGSVLRFRQLVDSAAIGRGNVDLSWQFANASTNSSTGAFPRIVARFGVSERVDVGAWGGLDTGGNYGLAGVDTKIVLLRQGAAWPVSVSIRPSLTSLIGPSDVWVGNASIDVSASRAFGPMSPYVGVATSGSLAIERSKDVDLDPATVDRSVAYAGLAYRWRLLSVSAEVEKGARVSYGLRIGTRF